MRATQQSMQESDNHSANFNGHIDSVGADINVPIHSSKNQLSLIFEQFQKSHTAGFNMPQNVVPANLNEKAQTLTQREATVENYISDANGLSNFELAYQNY